MTFRLPLTRLQLVAVLFAISTSGTAAEELQILRNGGFEEDEMTLRGEPASSCGGYSNDQWFNMQDLFPDGWIWPNALQPSVFGAAAQSSWPRPEVTLDKAMRRSGERSLRLEGKTATVQQTFEWNIVADLYGDATKPGAAAVPPPTLLVKPGFFNDLVLEGWAKSENVPQDATANVTLSLVGLSSKIVDLPKGTVDWQRFEVRLQASALAELNTANRSLLGSSSEVKLAYTSPSSAGRVWLDDLVLRAAARSEPNLLPNASFEKVMAAARAEPPKGRGTEMSGAARAGGETPYPERWSSSAKWTFLPTPHYYVWNNWQHFLTRGRGTPCVDQLVSRSGQRSLRFDLFGGDEYAIESPTIALNQAEARPLEVTAWVKADRLRHFDLILIDEQGRRLPANTTLTYWGGHVGGTHPWLSVRKIFQGYVPVKSVRLRIGARGFNGTTATDIGHWPAFNQVSTVWIDDAAVRELYSAPAELAARGVTIPNEVPPAGNVGASELDLGERLYGENEISAVLRNDQNAAALVAIEAQLITPAGVPLKSQRGAATTITAGGVASVAAPYDLTELSPSWRKAGRMRVTLLVDGKPAASETYGYGTWPVIANVRPSKAALDETENPILVAINLGVSRKTLSQAQRLKVDVVDRRNGRTMLSQEISDIPSAIAQAKIEDAAKDRFYFYMPRVGLMDHRNLILKELDISSLPLRAWNDPESDWILRVTATGAAGNLFTADSHAFARLTKMDDTLEPIREVTIDPVGKFFRVNGKPFYPLAQSHANGAANGGAPPSRAVSFSSDHIRVNGLNSAARWSGIKVINPNWEKDKVYGPMLMAGTAAFSHGDARVLKTLLPALEQGNLMLANNVDDGVLQPLDTVNKSPAALAYFTTYNEAILEAVCTPEQLKAEGEYADAVRKKLNRPIGIMDNHSQFYPWHDDDRLLDHFEVLYLEREAGAVFRPELTLRNWMKRKERWVVVDLPQTYENVPHARERYRAILNTLNGARGWFGIQGCADPSLYRMLGGELRFIFSYLSANEGTLAPQAPQGIQAKAWKKGNRILVIAEQHNPLPHGRWTWKQIDGRRAHTGVSSHLITPVKEGYAIHGYNDDIYREVTAGDAIAQEVYLAADRVPEAIFLIVPGNGDFNHVVYWGKFDHADFQQKKVDAFLTGECYCHAGYGINWYRGGAASFAPYQQAHRFPATAFVRLGDLPAAGQWTTLTVPPDKLNLVGRAVDGLMFMASGSGRAWWGKSTLVRSGGQQEVMLDGRIGRDPQNFRQTSFSLPGSASANIRVVGENRSVRMTDGRWTDDLHGEDLFDCLRDGYLGDGITYGTPVDSLPEALELGYTYDDSPRCVRVYEIQPDK